MTSIAPCAEPTDPKHGLKMDRDFRHGRSVRFYCYSGYQRVGVASITCNDGKWDGLVPECKGQEHCIFVLDFISWWQGLTGIDNVLSHNLESINTWKIWIPSAKLARFGFRADSFLTWGMGVCCSILFFQECRWENATGSPMLWRKLFWGLHH